MTTFHTDGTVTSLIELGSPEFTEMLATIRAGAAERELANENPFEAMKLVREARLGALRVPVAAGGGGASVRDLFEMVIALASADPIVAHILRSHYEFVETQLASPLDSSRARIELVAQGVLYGNAATEIGGSRDTGDSRWYTTLTASGHGYVLNGRKFYCTGTLFSDQMAVYATAPDERQRVAVIPVDREGVTLEDDWDGIGQSRTGSGTTILSDVPVREDELIDPETDGGWVVPYRSALPQLFLTAVIAGILRTVVHDAGELMQGRARTFSHAVGSTPALDPILQEAVGEIASASSAAEAMVLRAAEAQDAARDGQEPGRVDAELAHLASVRAAEAKVIVDRLATEAATALFDVAGASATRRDKNLDRHWRSIRTLASHNPAAYKAQALGDYYVNGRSLPQNGFF